MWHLLVIWQKFRNSQEISKCEFVIFCNFSDILIVLWENHQESCSLTLSEVLNEDNCWNTDLVSVEVNSVSPETALQLNQQIWPMTLIFSSGVHTWKTVSSFLSLSIQITWTDIITLSFSLPLSRCTENTAWQRFSLSLSSFLWGNWSLPCAVEHLLVWKQHTASPTFLSFSNNWTSTFNAASDLILDPLCLLKSSSGHFTNNSVNRGKKKTQNWSLLTLQIGVKTQMAILWSDVRLDLQPFLCQML